MSYVLQPGLAFQFQGVAEDVFFFAFSCSIIKGDGLYRRLNLQGAFIEQEWDGVFNRKVHHGFGLAYSIESIL